MGNPESAEISMADAGSPALTTCTPKAAIMAPLSVHRPGRGRRNSTPASAIRSASRVRRREFAATPPPMRGGRLPRVLFATQAATRPPTFVLFTSGQLEPGYQRFVERRLREEFGFVGTPVHVEVRAREKRGKR